LEDEIAADVVRDPPHPSPLPPGERGLISGSLPQRGEGTDTRHLVNEVRDSGSLPFAKGEGWGGGSSGREETAESSE
jgi:hypothetical protein